MCAVVKGSGGGPISVHDLVRDIAESTPAAPALTWKDETLDYATLLARASAVAGTFSDLGVRRGDRVAIYLDKRIETVLSILACSILGAVFVPVNPVLVAHQVGYVVADAAATLLVTTRARWTGVARVGERSLPLAAVILVDGPDQCSGEQTSSSPLVVPWSERSDGGLAMGGARTDGDVAAIFYTSGSTGQPKGVILSHRNLIVGAQSVSEYLANTGDDVILSLLPLSFDAGFSQLTTGFRVGAQVVLANYLLPKDAVELCARHEVTGLTCVPPLWVQLATAEWPPDVAARLRYFATTGGRMPRPVLDKLRGIFVDAKPYLMYGLTEAFRSTYLDPDQIDQRPDSIGKAIPNAEILVVRPDGSVCDDDEPGELVHLGPLVSLGYWNDVERTAERFRPAPGQLSGLPHVPLAVWSGDYVTRDSEGFLFFVGRRDEMIKTSGYRVSPSEVEEAVFGTGLARDVVALGLPDVNLGEHIVVVMAPSEPRDFEPKVLLTALRGVLPRFMLPHRVVALDELPRSPNGKYDRVRIRQELDQ